MTIADTWNQLAEVFEPLQEKLSKYEYYPITPMFVGRLASEIVEYMRLREEDYPILEKYTMSFANRVITIDFGEISITVHL